jgi:hypothetical protein
MAAFNGYFADPSLDAVNTGFRIARVPVPGDANGDGAVDIADLSILLTDFDKTGMTWSQGDFDGSGTVDIADLGKLLTNFDKSAAVAITPVPEPSSLLLLFDIGAAFLAWLKRK